MKKMQSNLASKPISYKTAVLFALGSLSILLTSANERYLTAATASDTPLVDAAEAQNWETVEKLMEEQIDVDQAQVDGMTALHWATYHEHEPTVLALLEHGASCDAETRYGIRPLSIACSNGNQVIASALLKMGADANAELRGGETALMTAARTGRLDIVAALVAAGAKLDESDRQKQTAIMWAAAEGHVEVVKFLVDAGADYTKPLATGFTPFFFAVREGRTAVAKLLLDSGIDVNQTMQARRSGGKLPRAQTSALVLAIENGHFELAAMLLERGADANDQRSGFAPLHILTWVRKPNRGDGEDGHPSPIGSGVIDSLAFVSKLIEHGADVDLRLEKNSGNGLNKKGATPFLMACATSDLEYMSALARLGADLGIPNSVGTTPIMAAAGVGVRAPFEEAGTEDEAIAAINWLIDHNAEVNSVDDNGETVMHGAAYKNLPRVVRLLAENGADIATWNKTNKRGWTPLLIAEGFRPGNFKPSHETIEAIHEVMRAEGIEPPPLTDPQSREKRVGYE